MAFALAAGLVNVAIVRDLTVLIWVIITALMFVSWRAAWTLLLDQQDLLNSACTLCRRLPATGLASIGENRYCHGDEDDEPTCFQRAEWPMRLVLPWDYLDRDNGPGVNR